MKRLILLLIPIFLISLISFSALTFAATKGSEKLKKAETFVDQALDKANKGDLSGSQKDYNQFKTQWLKIEDTVKSESGAAYKDVESAMRQVDYAFLVKKQTSTVSSLNGLQKVNRKFINGNYGSGVHFKKQNITLNDFIDMLNQVKSQTDAHNQAEALKKISNVRESWLSVEGQVVSQSSQIYNQAERDLVTVNAMIQNHNYQSASSRLSNMITYLSPLTLQKGYSIWDAAMIPVREGLEALLVVGALLAFVKKTNEGKGKGWIWSGVSLGIGLSAVLAILVKFVFNSGAFGDNNFLIAGITGLFAAIMLLYMSYWLHSKSNIAEWNRYIKAKSQAALTSGSLISLGFLTFLAVFREGTETVLFVIGMVNQISIQNLLLGLLIGLGILFVLAVLMFVIGVKLPIRPFFIVSSLIIFYLCLKFTGLGIHSLQLAGVLPTTLATYLPSISFIAFFPTWESSIPQIVLLIFSLSVLIWNRSKKKKVAD
jgi:high-affinity iron transporter